MTAKELEDRCRTLAKAFDGHVTLDFEDGYATASLVKDTGVIVCCRSTVDEALTALEESVPRSAIVLGSFTARKSGGSQN